MGTFKAKGPLPSIAIREHAAKKGLVCLLDEFRTSVQCSHCGNESLGKMYHPKKTVPRFACSECQERFLKTDEDNAQCSQGHNRGTQQVNETKTFICSKCQGQWNRDQNAAVNMQKIVQMYFGQFGDLGNIEIGRRPRYLCRDAERTFSNF